MWHKKKYFICIRKQFFLSPVHMKWCIVSSVFLLTRKSIINKCLKFSEFESMKMFSIHLKQTIIWHWKRYFAENKKINKNCIWMNLIELMLQSSLNYNEFRAIKQIDIKWREKSVANITRKNLHPEQNTIENIVGK